MAKAPISNGANTTQATAETEACLRIIALAGPHWRWSATGREGPCFGEAELAAAAKAKGLTADEFGALLFRTNCSPSAPARRPETGRRGLTLFPGRRRLAAPGRLRAEN